MKKLILILIINTVLLVSCKKNAPSPAAPPAPAPTQNVAAPNPTLTVTENALVGIWYFEKSESITSNSIMATTSYSGVMTFNSLEFKCTMSAVSTNTAYPNFKEYVQIQNGNTIPTGAWKVPPTGNLMLSILPVATCLIDSLTATRFVYTSTLGYPTINGTRYYLHK